jgi:hypothetical protein
MNRTAVVEATNREYASELAPDEMEAVAGGGRLRFDIPFGIDPPLPPLLLGLEGIELGV